MEEDNLKASNINVNRTERYLNPSAINLPAGYMIEIIAHGLNLPYSMVFTPDGDLLIAESGLVSGNSRILNLSNGNFRVVAEYYNSLITGISVINGIIYVTHKGSISIIQQDGSRKTIISGLPSYGDYGNSNVVFREFDQKIYFGQGTATNSGVVGQDNIWLKDYSFFHDYPGNYILMRGTNFSTKNLLVSNDEIVYTGAFTPYGVPNALNEIIKGVTKASGSILKANPDGTELELVAWGFRFPAHLELDRSNNLFVANHGYTIRGSRPIANAQDDFHMVRDGLWYGWPDYVGNEPINQSKFKPSGEVQPEFLLKSHPNIPPIPYARFPANSTIMGFDFNYNESFGKAGDVYIAELGNVWPNIPGDFTPYTGVGHRVSRIHMETGRVSTFAINKSGFPFTISGEGGFGRPIDIVFGPDGAMYILDLGISIRDQYDVFLENTGVLWKVTRI